MRKLISFFMATILLFVLAGCGSKDAEEASVDPHDIPSYRLLGEFAQDWVKIGPRQKATADGMQFSSLGGHMEGKKLTASVEITPTISFKSVEFSLIKAALDFEYTDASVELHGVSKSISAGESIQFFYSMVYKVYEVTMRDAQRTRYTCKVPGEDAIMWGYQLFDNDGKLTQDTTVDLREYNREHGTNIHLGAKQFVDHTNHCYSYYVRYTMDSKDFIEADDYCESVGGHLVDIGSEEENDFVFNVVCKGNTANQPYVGLWATDEGHWYFYKDAYYNWDDGEPSKTAGEDYAAFSSKSNGKWNNVPNNTSDSFICEWEIPFKNISNAPR